MAKYNWGCKRRKFGRKFAKLLVQIILNRLTTSDMKRRKFGRKFNSISPNIRVQLLNSPTAVGELQSTGSEAVTNSAATFAEL